MHIIIGLITAIAGLIWALNSLQRSGLDLSALNPFFIYRRYQWNKKYGQKPLYTIDHPLDAAAVLILGIAKLEGEISKEHKNNIIDIFKSEFRLDSAKAAELFSSTSFLLKDEYDLVKNIGKILNNSKDRFTHEQIDSALALMHKTAVLESPLTKDQEDLLNSVSSIFLPAKKTHKKWS